MKQGREKWQSGGEFSSSMPLKVLWHEFQCICPREQRSVHPQFLSPPPPPPPPVMSCPRQLAAPSRQVVQNGSCWSSHTTSERLQGKRLRGKTVSKSTIRKQGRAFMELADATVAAVRGGSKKILKWPRGARYRQCENTFQMDCMFYVREKGKLRVILPVLFLSTTRMEPPLTEREDHGKYDYVPSSLKVEGHEPLEE